MKYIESDMWKTQGIVDLEEAAWDALREPGCTSVLAGPGAGKTEFLAQRAAYLLQTGICHPPSRILAISFKKDAAENLSARVQRRCGPELSSRFDSLTFDAFTKGLVDRFYTSLPKELQPTKPYNVAFPTKTEVRQFLATARVGANPVWQPEIALINPDNFESNYIGGQRLEPKLLDPTTAVDFLVQLWWRKFLLKRPQSDVSFVMLNRLAELLLRTRPQILKSLHLTYPYVFIDEFQDTTYAQYDFLLSAFGGSQTIVTAVGDNKQRIMGWAGALPNAFQQFQADFSAKEISLRLNYRSSPGLVKIQQVVAQALDSGAAEAETRVVKTVEGEIAQVWNFPNNVSEAYQIASWLADDMLSRKTRPRDYALLVKQKAESFEEELKNAMDEKSLRIRNESKYVGKITIQDLLVDELVNISLSMIKVAILPRAPEALDIVTEAMMRLHGVDPDDEVRYQKVEKQTRTFINRLRVFMQKAPTHPKHADTILNHLLEFINPGLLARAYPEYGKGDNLAISTEGLRLHFANSARDTKTWTECIEAFEGENSVPLMTVHKSKGLEYDTVIFIGLDDGTWRYHTRGNIESIATFFVALSRAKQRIVFTFCSTRGPKDLIDDLYALLRTAGVPEIEYDAPTS